MKTIYLASSFKQRETIAEVSRVLLNTNWKIIDLWWEVDEKETLPQYPKAFYAEPITQTIAARHWEAIKKADAFILVANPHTITRFTGGAVEFGYAHALGKPLVIYGRAKLSAMFAPAIHCLNLNELETVMKNLDYSSPGENKTMREFNCITPVSKTNRKCKNKGIHPVFDTQTGITYYICNPHKRMLDRRYANHKN